MHSRHAHYDENGDIVLRPANEQSVFAPDEDVDVSIAPKRTESATPGVLRRATGQLLLEGTRQLETSIEETSVLPRKLRGEFMEAMRAFWSTLQQPVWVPGRKGKPKKYTRGTLFLFDTVRFGGTFAAVFGVLFLTLNYQSFFSILQASIDPLSAASAGDVLQEDLTDAPVPTATGAVTAPTGGASDRKSLLGLLPPVGPPENRLIIPKLNLNVPIVTPSQDALLQENWKQLETDIQGALEQGVVYYPGTAKPGQAGNFFVTGHSSYYPWSPGKFKSVFARLSELKEGDEYWVYYNGDKHRYRIDSKQEVQPSNVSVLDQPTDQRRATLMTCTPVGTALRRLIVGAVEVAEDGSVMKVGEHEKRDDAQKTQLELLPI